MSQVVRPILAVCVEDGCLMWRVLVDVGDGWSVVEGECIGGGG